MSAILAVVFFLGTQIAIVVDMENEEAKKEVQTNETPSN